MSLLFDFRPLVINPQLAERIGLNEAIVLQQLKYWLSETDAGIEHEGRRWIYNTLDQWQKQFPFWSVDTVKRALKSLQAQGIILAEQLAKSKHDRTNHYAINYQSNALFEEGKLHCSEQGNLHSSTGAGCPVLHTEITTKTTHEINRGAGKPVRARSNVKSATFDPLTAKPPNVTEQAWADWCQHRKEIRKPLTAKSCEQQAKALAGHCDPDAVLATSISNGWTGIFPENVLPGASARPATLGQPSAVLHVPTHTQDMYPDDRI